jgi:ubiquinone/menaquinone biosynthesis C-methylase UbiE
MRSPLAPLVRRFYKQLYNRFAFTYDLVSSIVSRGEWRAWTQAAIPFTQGHGRVLEIAFGTGNLLLDLLDSGLRPIGVELSPFMIEITQRKFKRRGTSPSIIRAAVQRLPFPSGHFDSIVMTFPPGFAKDPIAMKEVGRALAEDGSVIWVDAPYLYPRDVWSRLLNWAFTVTGEAPQRCPDEEKRLPNQDKPGESQESLPRELLPRDGWCWSVKRVNFQRGYVHVMIGIKDNEERTKTR